MRWLLSYYSYLFTRQWLSAAPSLSGPVSLFRSLKKAIELAKDNDSILF